MIESLNPNSLDEFIGQPTIVNNLKIFIEAALKRQVVLDHVLFYGDSGLGKTTLSRLIAQHMEASFKIINAATVDSTAQLAHVFASVKAGDVILIDEIHQLNARCEEFLYPILQDYRMDFLIQYATNSRMVNLKLPPFTCIGATTAISACSKPLRERFPIKFHLKPYTQQEIIAIIDHHAKLLNMSITDPAKMILATACRLIPRNLNAYLRRLHDYQIVLDVQVIDESFINDYLKANELNQYGLDRVDQMILKFLDSHKRPLGVNALATLCGIDVNELIHLHEPYLLALGFICYTHAGRMITDKGRNVLSSLFI